MLDFVSSLSARTVLVAAAAVAVLALMSVGGAFGRGSRSRWDSAPETPKRDLPPVDRLAPSRVETATFAFG